MVAVLLPDASSGYSRRFKVVEFNFNVSSIRDSMA